MKFKNIFINKTSISIAVENENVEAIKLLLACPKLDINRPNIFFIVL